MILLTTALMIEARPLAAGLGLRALSGEVFPVYQGDGLILVVTGVGTLKAGIAVGWAMGRFQGIIGAVNVGFCGAAPEVADRGDWIYISSIRDQASGRLSVPDILQAQPFREVELLTVPEVVKGGLDWPGVVDMEGSGFFEAARKFISPDRIALIKWVSDPLSGTIDIKETSEAFTAALEPAILFIRRWPERFATEEDKSHDYLVKEVEQRLKLTRTQLNFLNKWASGYVARGGDPGEIRKLLPDSIPGGKAGNTRIFESLKNVFKS